LVIPDVGGERSGESQSGECDRSIRGIAAGFDRLDMIERQLVPVRKHEPPSRYVLNRLDSTFEQSDEYIRRRVTDANDIPLPHATMQYSIPLRE
jgi:hypothetical protein